MREMLLAEKETPLASIMIRDPFALRPNMSLTDAMKSTVIQAFSGLSGDATRNGRLVGIGARHGALRGAGVRV